MNLKIKMMMTMKPSNKKAKVLMMMKFNKNEKMHLEIFILKEFKRKSNLKAKVKAHNVSKTIYIKNSLSTKIKLINKSKAMILQIF